MDNILDPTWLYFAVRLLAVKPAEVYMVAAPDEMHAAIGVNKLLVQQAAPPCSLAIVTLGPVSMGEETAKGKLLALMADHRWTPTGIKPILAPYIPKAVNKERLN